MPTGRWSSATCRSAPTRSRTTTPFERDPVRQGGGRRRRQAGGRGPMVSRVRRIVQSGIPVMGQSASPRSRQRCSAASRRRASGQAARRLLVDALALEEAGCFSIVLEAIPDRSRDGSRGLSIPTIGIGAGARLRRPGARLSRPARADRGPLPRFVKRYANLSREIRDALRRIPPTCVGAFPGAEHTYSMSEAEQEAFAGTTSSQPSCHWRGTSAGSSTSPRRRGGRAPSGWPNGRSRRAARRGGDRLRARRRSTYR